MEKPKSVSLGVNLLWVSLALEVLAAIPGPLNKSLTPGTYVFIVAATAVIMAFLTYMILRGRNWARIVFLVLFLFGLIPSLQSVFHTFSVSPVVAISGILQTVLQAAALFFLFSTAAKPWFKKKAG